MLKGMPVLLIILVATSARAQTNLLDKLTEPFKRNSAVTGQQVDSDSEPRPATASARRHHTHYSPVVDNRMIQRRRSEVSAENVVVRQEVDTNWEVDTTPVLYTSPLFNDLTLMEDAWFADFNKNGPPEDSVWPDMASLQSETLQQHEDVHQVDHAGRSAATQGFVLAAGSATGLALGMWMFVFRRQKRDKTSGASSPTAQLGAYIERISSSAAAIVCAGTSAMGGRESAGTRGCASDVRFGSKADMTVRCG